MSRLSTVSVLLLLALGAQAQARADQTIRIKGSDTIGGQMMPVMAETYRARGASVGFEIEALGSGTAFVGLFDGSADIGESSRPISEKEAETAARLGMKLNELVIGYDGVAVVVHPSNPVKTLSILDLSQLFTGRIRNWKQLGGPDRTVRLISRPSYSGTHAFFKEKAVRRGNAKGPEEFAAETQLMEENGEILAAVATDPGAVSYVGLGWLKPSVRAVPIAARPGEPGIEAKSETVRNGRYPLYRALYMYVPANPGSAALSFLRFVLSRDGAAVVAASGFIPLDASAPLPAFIGAAPSPSAPTAVVAAATSDAPAAPVAAPPAASVAPAIATTTPTTPQPPAAPERKRQTFRVVFPYGTSTLSAEASATVGRVAEILRQGGFTAIVSGHADAKGSVEANRAIAQARALAVSARLVHQGVEQRLVRTEASGADSPIASNESADGRAANRRVDIELIPAVTAEFAIRR
jgi:phosphate transport system substrate-binding protein